MAFFRDKDGAIWVEDVRDDMMSCLFDPDYQIDAYMIGIRIIRGDVERDFGPLVRVEPTGWTEFTPRASSD